MTAEAAAPSHILRQGAESAETTFGGGGALPVPRADDLIPLYLPVLGAAEQQAAAAALADGWLGIGPLTGRFERELGAFLGLRPDRHLVSTSSCTSALHLAALTAGIGPGAEVICPSFTYVAGHQAMSATGADVVFCDIDPKTLTVDPASVRSVITPRTRAIQVVHYAGVPADLDAIHAIAAEHDLRVIEDAAHAFGSSSRGRAIGSFGDLVCFSFGPVKMITSLEGGAVVSPRVEDVQLLHELRLIGVTADTDARYARQRMWEYDVVRQGYRYHLGSLPAAIGLAQLAQVDAFIANRRSYCRQYDAGLSDLDGVEPMAVAWDEIAPYMYVLRLRDASLRAGFMAHLRGLGVATGVHYMGGHTFTHYRECQRADLSVTETVAEQVVTLPLHSFMTEQTRERVIAAVRSYFS